MISLQPSTELQPSPREGTDKWTSTIYATPASSHLMFAIPHPEDGDRLLIIDKLPFLSPDNAVEFSWVKSYMQRI